MGKVPQELTANGWKHGEPVWICLGFYGPTEPKKKNSPPHPPQKRKHPQTNRHTQTDCWWSNFWGSFLKWNPFWVFSLNPIIFVRSLGRSGNLRAGVLLECVCVCVCVLFRVSEQLPEIPLPQKLLLNYQLGSDPGLVGHSARLRTWACSWMQSAECRVRFF